LQLNAGIVHILLLGKQTTLRTLLVFFESVGNYPSNNLPKVIWVAASFRILGHKLSSPGALNDFTEDNLL